MIKIEELTDEMFAKCTIKYSYGYVYLNDENNLFFSNRFSNRQQMVTPAQVELLNGKKFKLNLLRKNIKKIAKIKLNEKSKYLVVPKDDILTLNDKPLKAHTIILMTDPPIIYTKIKLFCLEIKTTEKPDFETAKVNYLTGNRNNTSFRDALIADSPILLTPNEPPETNNIVTPNIQNKSIKTKNDPSLYIITKLLFKEQEDGTVDFWGYLLQDGKGNMIQKDENTVKDLINKNLIKNATLRNNNIVGKDIDLDELEQDYVEE